MVKRLTGRGASVRPGGGDPPPIFDQQQTKFTVVLLQDGNPFHWLIVTTTVVPPEIPVKHRGRPKAGAPIETRTEYTIEFQATEPTPEVIQAERERRSTFILLTSNLALDARIALQEYKSEDQNEHGFRWTKSPIHLGTFGLEKPARVPD